MGRLVVHAGPLGDGETVKIINNAVAAANCATLAEALLVGQATGIDLGALVTVMGHGSGGSAMLDLKAAPMLAHDYTTLFKLEHMLKDVRLCLEEAQAADVPFAAAAHARDVLVAAMARGHADDDFVALVEGLEAFADRRLGGVALQAKAPCLQGYLVVCADLWNNHRAPVARITLDST